MSTKLSLLKNIDPEVWVDGSERCVQKMLQPRVSQVPVPGILCLKYRSLYYYSLDSQHPYVVFKFGKQFRYPLVVTCNRTTYERFVNEHNNNQNGSFEFEYIQQ